MKMAKMAVSHGARQSHSEKIRSHPTRRRAGSESRYSGRSRRTSPVRGKRRGAVKAHGLKRQTFTISQHDRRREVEVRSERVITNGDITYDVISVAIDRSPGPAPLPLSCGKRCRSVASRITGNGPLPLGAS